MTVPALVHQMPFTGSVSGTKKENDRLWGETWLAFNYPKAQNGEYFSKRPRVLTTVKGERQSDIGGGIGVKA